MTAVIFSSKMDVELVQSVGSDTMIAAAARVSTGKDIGTHSGTADAGLINYLVSHRHGSPFEHNLMTFRISAPIFVFREFMRHRIGWSYNEESGRYKKLDPKFYVYPNERPLAQAGSSAHPQLVPGTGALAAEVRFQTSRAYEDAWIRYERMLDSGAANEVARTVLPVGIYSTMYATCNARSLMAFLSLRRDVEHATFETKPQWEIDNVAEQMEAVFKDLFPETWRAFDMNGRVSP